MAVNVRTRPLTRDKIATFLKSPELIKAFENLTSDVGTTLPAAIDAVAVDVAAATADAAAAVVTANAASAAATTAQTDAAAALVAAAAAQAASNTLTGNETNWATFRSSAVANMLGWKNFGNGHVIFDASASTSPTGSAVSNTDSTNAWTATYPTLMGWNGAQTYGVRVDRSRQAESLTTVVGSAPSYACRVWVNFDGTTGTIRASGNVSSVTRNGVGDYTVNFTTAMPDVNYAVTTSGFDSNNGRGFGVLDGRSTAPGTYQLTTSVRLRNAAVSADVLDLVNASAAIFR